MDRLKQIPQEVGERVHGARARARARVSEREKERDRYRVLPGNRNNGF